MNLTTTQLDRAKGALIGAAVGDALGAPVEFTTPEPGTIHTMTGGGVFNWGVGEWTDDTSMALCIAQAAAHHTDLAQGPGLDAIASNFLDWYASSPPDVGSQTSAVLFEFSPNARRMQKVAKNLNRQKAGNGSLMRTAPVALAYLSDVEGCMRAASEISALTHYDVSAITACQLWSYAIRHAVLEGDFLGAAWFLERSNLASFWRGVLKDAENGVMPEGGSNFWVVGALAAAWNAVLTTESFEDAVQKAINWGGDTDTVAAIAGALAGAKYGLSGIPGEWRAVLHGYPGVGVADLEALVERIVLHPDR